MKTNSFEETPKNKVRQVAKRAEYDRETIYSVLDRSLVCHVAFANNNSPTCIPMFFARDNDQLLFHGSTKSRLMQMLASGNEICVSVTLLDGLVLARSLFHHSMNYRSVTVFGSGKELTGDEERNQALRIITDKTMKGRWDDARQPSAQELKATSIVAVSINSAAAKIRTGGPSDDAEDQALPVWAGVIPFTTVIGEPIPDENRTNGIPLPDYLKTWMLESAK